MGTFRIAAAAMLLGAVATTATPAFAAKKEAEPAKAAALKLSKPVQVALADAQKAQAANDLTTALAKVREAEAAPSRTDDDNYAIAATKLNVAIGTRKAEEASGKTPPSGQASAGDALLEESLNGMLASARTSDADRPKFQRTLAQLALQRNDYNTATTRYEGLVAANPTDGEQLFTLGELYRVQKQSAKASDAYARAIAAASASGQPAKEDWYRRRFEVAYNAKLPDLQAAALANVTAYPTRTNWRDALLTLRDTNKIDDQQLLDVMRLMAAANALNGERDFYEYAQTASDRGLPGEAKSALAAGKANGAVGTKPVFAELQASVDKKVGADRAALPGLDREARAAANGKPALGTADAYYGYGDYAKAADLYRVALSKGGVDADTANLRLGASLARAGDKAGATAALANIKGTGVRPGLAQYWQVWLTQQKA